MSEISIDLIWKLDNGVLSPGKYSNKHEIKFSSNLVLVGDSAPDWAGDPINSNPGANISSFFKQLSYDDLSSYSSKNELASNKLPRSCCCNTRKKIQKEKCQ